MLPLSTNFTTPVTLAKRVSSLPRPTFNPGFRRVPRCRTMIEPPGTSCPPNAFTPSRCAFESRPFFELPNPFLCAIAGSSCQWPVASGQLNLFSYFFLLGFLLAADFALALVAVLATLPEPAARERLTCESPLSAFALWTPSAGTEAFSPLNSMPVMRTAVNCWRCPISFLYCFLRLNLKTRILSPRPSSITSPVTRAPLASVEKVLPLTAKTSANSMSPPLCCVFSTLITSPGATRYCLPPERMTAYIEVSKYSPRAATNQQNFGAGAQVQGFNQCEVLPCEDGHYRQTQ